MALANTNMKLKFTSLITLIALGANSLIPVALAAFNDVQIPSGGTIVLTVAGSDLEFTVTSGLLEAINVNPSSVTVTLASGGSTLSVTSADKKNFSYGSGGGLTTEFTCNSSSSVLSVSGAGTTTITPLETTCTVSSGSGGGGSGSSGGGGGGGGGTSAPSTTTTTPAPAATSAPAPATAAVVQQVTPVAPAVAKPSPVAQLVSPVFNKDLTLGSKGDDIKRLQQLLAQDKAIYPEGQVTGYFGNLTRNAIRNFQLKYGVIKKANDPGNGNLGPKTRAKLKDVFGSLPAVSAPVVAPVVPASTPATTPATYKSQSDQLQALLKQLQELQAKLKAKQ